MTNVKQERAVHLLDNSTDKRSVGQLIRDQLGEVQTLDVATGFFEIGGLLELAEGWNGLDRIRILMGSHLGERTRQLLVKQLRPELEERLAGSLQAERRDNPLLDGVAAIAAALKEGRLECRMHTKGGRKFHAKAFILGANDGAAPRAAIVGSSNFTRPGLDKNVELNVEYTDAASTTELADWFEKHWEEGEDVHDEFLEILERSVHEYVPYEAYLKSVESLVRGRELGNEEFERKSDLFKALDECQKRGYREVLDNARRHGGAFLCDGVGMGKTFIGLMLIERLCRFERKRVALFAPKSARESVWEVEVSKWLPGLKTAYGNSLLMFSHTDFQRTADPFPGVLDQVRTEADAIIIDEAHYFRNKGVTGEGKGERSWYWKLRDLITNPDGTRKMVFLLTATPINNGLQDFRNQLELFSGDDPHHLKHVGIASIPGHIKELEKAIEAQGKDPSQAPDLLRENRLFREVVTQRSRSFAKSLQASDPDARALLFPEREKPIVAKYSIRKTCGSLLDLLSEAFDPKNPGLQLSLYYPLQYDLTENADDFERNRQKQLVGLIRTLLVKRLESSIRSFESSCHMMLKKMLAWCDVHGESLEEKDRLDAWKEEHGKLLGIVAKRQGELWDVHGEPVDTESEEDIIPVELIAAVEEQSRETVDVVRILDDTFSDMDQLIGFLELANQIDDAQDDKVRKLIALLSSDEELAGRKVLIFTEFADTARYLERRLKEAGIPGVESVTSRSNKDRRDVVQRFSPFYNDTDPIDLNVHGRQEIEVLISTDMLADGLNLQDATRLINYDIHWNPVQIIQRIGRVDRRLNPEIEEKIKQDRAATNKNGERGRIVYWNFLPPEDLAKLISLMQKVSHKTFVISATMGVQTGHLLSPDEKLDDIQEYHRFEEFLDGKQSTEEMLSLELKAALEADPGLAGRLAEIPDGVLSGRVRDGAAPVGVFLCYRLPGRDREATTTDAAIWTAEAGRTAWYFAPLSSDVVEDDLGRIHEWVRCEPDEPRNVVWDRDKLLEVKARVDKHIKNTYLKKLLVPQGVDPELIAWMELNEG